MVGRRLSHYDIQERLGRGGMGEVFLAHDRALGRPAAIKVIPEALDPDLRRRLIREAETSQRLQHPGIATFFETGEEEGTTFIAMEFVRGETLRARLRRGPMAAPEAIAAASMLLEALGHAHAAGIVHRDIKPENIMVAASGVTGVKLLDFGLAYHAPLRDPDAATTLSSLGSMATEVGTVLGTIGYMSPEQLRGEPADARSDLFALGAVLYEMLRGEPAFPGPSPVARITATLAGTPHPVPGIPNDLQAAVRRSLASAREERFQSAAEFLRALRHVGEGGAPHDASVPESIAVLDFETRSTDPRDSWIGAGITESLSADLGRIPALAIVPRTKIARTASEGGARDPAAIGARLGCRWVLSGSCQRMGPSLRIIMSLTHVPTEQTTATEKIDGSMDDIFAMQDRLGRTAAEALRLEERVTPATVRAAPALGAYECYTRGRQHWTRLTKGAFDQAEEHFLEAIRQEPAYADALAGLAAVHDMRFTFTTDRTELERALEFADRAVAEAPDHAEGHVWLGYALWRLGRSEEALSIFRRGAELDPKSNYPPYFLGCVLQSRGEYAEAVPPLQRAVALAPGFGFAWAALGNTLMESGQYQEAEWSLGRGIELERAGLHATAGAAGYLGECFRRQGKKDAARAQCLAGLEAVERTDHMYRDTFRAVCLNALGRVALDQGDREAAVAAFTQCRLHLEGRARSLGGGWLFCQALAGLATALEGSVGGAESLRRALALFESRGDFDWSYIWLCNERTTVADIARAQARRGHLSP